jgi:tellurite resistance protein TehA-like permease
MEMISLTLVHQWGHGWGLVAYVLWWINTAMSVIACFAIPYVHVKLQPPGVQSIAPTVLLPLIAALTSAAGCGVLCVYGTISDRLQVPVIIASYLEVGVGILLAISIVDLFQSRLFNKSFPPLEHVYEDMILCGPFGQGSFALLILGQAVRNGSFAQYDRGTFLTAEAATPLADDIMAGTAPYPYTLGILSCQRLLYRNST